MRDVEGRRVVRHVKEVIRLEARALSGLLPHVDGSYARAVDLIRRSPGKVVLTGMGKSGLIARKIAATMSSTGTQAVFLHPAEAMHGDLGVVEKGDVVIALGKSGESDELASLFPVLRRIGTRIIAVTGNPRSTLAANADVVLYGGVAREACPHDLTPTASTTAALAIGDALAVALMRLRDFRPEDFAVYHPGGRLGRRLLLKVGDLMVPREKCPVLDPRKARMQDVIVGLSGGGLGIVLFSRDGRRLDGILTDGDIRRLLERHKSAVFGVGVREAMNPKPFTVQKSVMASEALRFMEERPRPLNVLPVLEGRNLAGIVRLHELLRVA